MEEEKSNSGPTTERSHSFLSLIWNRLTRGDSNSMKDPTKSGHHTHHQSDRGGRHHRISRSRSGSAFEEDDEDNLSESDMVGLIEVREGDTLANRYKVLSRAGQGTFGTVLEVHDTKYDELLALKVVRAVKRYTEDARTEIEILEALNKADPLKEGLCVRLRRHFELDYRGQRHMCLGFEKLGRSLYEFSKRNGGRGFRLVDVRHFAFQLMVSVAFCHHIGLIHTDLKPENILLHSSRYETTNIEPAHVKGLRDYNKSISSSSSSSSNSSSSSSSSSNSSSSSSSSSSPPAPYRYPKTIDIRLIDFGGATFSDREHARVVNTRQYRSPEVLLGLGWSYPSDVWSAACIVAELFTGELLFSTHDDLEHLALMEKVLERKLPDDMLQAAVGLANPNTSDESSSSIATPRSSNSNATVTGSRRSSFSSSSSMRNGRRDEESERRRDGRTYTDDNKYTGRRRTRSYSPPSSHRHRRTSGWGDRERDRGNRRDGNDRDRDRYDRGRYDDGRRRSRSLDRDRDMERDRRRERSNERRGGRRATRSRSPAERRYYERRGSDGGNNSSSNSSSGYWRGRRDDRELSNTSRDRYRERDRERERGRERERERAYGHQNGYSASDRDRGGRNDDTFEARRRQRDGDRGRNYRSMSAERWSDRDRQKGRGIHEKDDQARYERRTSRSASRHRRGHENREHRRRGRRREDDEDDDEDGSSYSRSHSRSRSSSKRSHSSYDSRSYSDEDSRSGSRSGSSYYSSSRSRSGSSGSLNSDDDDRKPSDEDDENRDWNQVRKRSRSTLRPEELVSKKTLGLRWPGNAVSRNSLERVRRAKTLKQIAFIGWNGTVEKNADMNNPSSQELNELFDFLNYLLCYDPRKRPTARDALFHPFFTKLRHLYRQPAFLKTPDRLIPHTFERPKLPPLPPQEM